MVRNGVDIFDSDLVALCVCGNFVYLGNEPAHDIAADGDEPLSSVELDALVLSRKALDYPFDERIA